METLTFPLEQPYIEEVVCELNRVFGDRSMWKEQLNPFMADYFGVVFSGGGSGGGIGIGVSMGAGVAVAGEEEEQPAYDEVMGGGGSSQGGGSLSSSGMSEKNSIMPRSAPRVVMAENDDGEDDAEEAVEKRPTSTGMFATLRRGFSRRAPVLEPAVLLPAEESVDPAPALPPPRIDDPFGAIHQMPAGTSLLLMRIVSQMGLAFSDRVTTPIRESLTRRQTATLLTKRAAFDVGDLQELGERVKPLNIIPEAQGYVAIHHAKAAITLADQMHYYGLAVSFFSEALAGNTVSKSLLRSYAGVLLDVELAAGRPLELGTGTQAQRISELYHEALRHDPEDSFTLGQYGLFLSKCNRLEDAKLAYLRSILCNPNEECVQRYCMLLATADADELFETWKSYK